MEFIFVYWKIVNLKPIKFYDIQNKNFPSYKTYFKEIFSYLKIFKYFKKLFIIWKLTI